MPIPIQELYFLGLKIAEYHLSQNWQFLYTFRISLINYICYEDSSFMDY